MAEHNAVYHIRTFGGFTIQSGRRRLGEEQNRMAQVWCCLEYLVAFRRERITQPQLAAILWPDKPYEELGSALKNIIYRVRMLLSETFPQETRPFILASHGCYSWNNAIECNVDSEDFILLLSRSSAAFMEQERQRSLLEAAEALHRGRYLPGMQQAWVLPIRTGYDRMYQSVVEQLCEGYLQQQDYEKAEALCRRALSHQPENSALKALLVSVLAGSGAHEEALQEYSRNFGSDPGDPSPEDLRLKAYRHIIKPMAWLPRDLQVIRLHMQRHLEADPRILDPVAFGNLHRGYARMAEATGQTVQVFLLSLYGQTGEAIFGEQLAVAAEELQKAFEEALLPVDVAARFSPYQYLLLVVRPTAAGCEKTVEAVEHAAKKLWQAQPVKLVVSLP